MNCLFSIDLMLIDARIHTFLNKTPTNNFPFESFPLVQFLLIVLSVKVTYNRNECVARVAYSQGCASDDSRAHLVIESGPSIIVHGRLGYKFSVHNFIVHKFIEHTVIVHDGIVHETSFILLTKNVCSR